MNMLRRETVSQRQTYLPEKGAACVPGRYSYDFSLIRFVYHCQKHKCQGMQFDGILIFVYL